MTDDTREREKSSRTDPDSDDAQTQTQTQIREVTTDISELIADAVSETDLIGAMTEVKGVDYMGRGELLLTLRGQREEDSEEVSA